MKHKSNPQPPRFHEAVTGIAAAVLSLLFIFAAMGLALHFVMPFLMKHL